MAAPISTGTEIGAAIVGMRSAYRKLQSTVQNHGGNLMHIDHSVEQERNIPVGVPNGKHIVCGSIVPHLIFRTVLEADLGYGNVSVGIVPHIGGVHADGNGRNLNFAISQRGKAIPTPSHGKGKSKRKQGFVALKYFKIIPMQP